MEFRLRLIVLNPKEKNSVGFFPSGSHCDKYRPARIFSRPVVTTTFINVATSCIDCLLLAVLLEGRKRYHTWHPVLTTDSNTRTNNMTGTLGGKSRCQRISNRGVV